MEWGGYSGDKVWLNLWAWYWAIAEGGSPADIDPAALAETLGVSLEKAAGHIARAERHYRADVRSNQRTGEFQALSRRTKAQLREEAARAGLKTTGWELKAEIVDRLVQLRYPWPVAA